MKVLVYVECGNLDDIDNSLGEGVDSGTIEKYAIVTVDGAPILYDEFSDSAAEYLNSLGMQCAGATE